MHKLGIYFWIRVCVMTISLGAVVATIYKLNHPGSRGLLEMLAGVGSPNKVKLCPTRVSSVSVIGKTAVFQEDMKWYRTQAGEREELDPVAMEMWFSEYCTVKSEPTEKPAGDSQPVLTLAYVAGLPVTLQMADNGVFTLGKAHFRSVKLAEAIQALTEIPKASTPK
jgi:hypothetical protein